MAYNRENYRKIRAAYQTKYQRAQEIADARMREVHAASPEIEEIDRALNRTGLDIMEAALSGGDTYEKRLSEIREKNEALQKRRAACLAALGYPKDYTKPPFECPTCMDSGFVETKMCDCMRRELILAGLASSGLGKLLETQSFGTFRLDFYKDDPLVLEQMKRNLQILRDYAETFTTNAGNLLLCGNTGLGKTHLSTAVARRVIERGFDVVYVGAIELFSEFERVRFGAGSDGMRGDRLAPGAGDETARFTECELLILDDLGTEVTNQFTSSCLYYVLNERISRGLPMIFNTNLTGTELRKRYADRIASRILGEFRPLVFAGTDVRRQKLH